MYAGDMKDKIQNSRLTLQDVSLSFGTMPVLQNLSLSVNSGEFAVIVGPSGCGKTTILNLLSGHIQPGSGAIHREGVIRTVYQKDGLFPWLTVSQNISMGLRSVSDAQQREEELQSLFELIHLEDFKNHYPHELSGGMRQRVELARALAGNSDILLMDEPFSALDYQTRLRMRYELVRLLEKRPRTVIFVTHDIEEAAQLADRVLVLSKRPATILKELEITASKPRGLTDGEVVKAMKEILEELGILREIVV
ncbi:NitT/TauT family transport system ATP-binding protein [Parafilimonas terrae]|uniref:NitT/TauT family transport system ATP-binding protein n=2 Tax=Parafilimonas terrae TaxID=1465490 RepID=A0A1I5XUF3_9BACT|nr:NitT/TauT family transport system ATP-binding protein [Parafilimonas terrae]